MRYSFSLIGSLLIFLTFLHTITLAQEINGTMDAFYQTTESTTEEGIDKTWNVTQGYFVGFKNAITPQMNYSLNVRTTINETGMQKTTTIFPSTQFNITNDLFGGSLGYHILERDPSNSTRFTSSAWNLNLNSKLKKIPQIRFQYSQDKNYDHLTIHSTNDKAEQFFSGIQYKYDFLSMLFNYSQRNVDNYVQNTIQESENHLGKIDFRKSLFGNKLSVSSEYGWNRDTSTTQFGSNITQLEKRNAIHGLYINDTTPDLGTLDETDILIDNDYATSTSIDIGSTGEDNQNIGADLSFLQTCEMIYLYTTPDPSFSSSRFRWEVYSSNDGDNWNLIDSQASFDYNNVYDRFEIAFPSQQSRFFKIVNTSHDDRAFVGPVYITEIEILGSEERQAGEVDENTTSGWETSTMMTFRPLEKVTFGYTFSYDFNKSKPDYTDNTEKSHGANLLWDIHQYLTSSAQYWTRTDTTSGRKSQNDSYSFQFYSSPLDTLSGSLSFNHSETEETGEELTKSKTDSYLLHLTTTLLEGVDLSSDFHITQAENSTGTKSTGKSIDMDLRTELTKKTTVEMGFNQSWQKSENNEAEITKTDSKNFDLTMSYTPSDILYLNADFDVNNTQEGTDTSYGMNISWLPTEKLQMNVSSKFENNNEETSSYNLDVSWNISRSFIFKCGYNYSQSRGEKKDENQTFYTRISTRF